MMMVMVMMVMVMMVMVMVMMVMVVRETFWSVLYLLLPIQYTGYLFSFERFHCTHLNLIINSTI